MPNICSDNQFSINNKSNNWDNNTVIYNKILIFKYWA